MTISITKPTAKTYNDMKRVLFLFVLVALLASCGSAKSVTYIHKPLAAEGCEVSYSAIQQDGQLYIVVTVKSDRLVFNDSPTLMLRNFEDKVLKLDGTNLQSRTENSGMLISNVYVPISELNAMAQFPVDSTDIDFFMSGIAKVRLSTVPIVHEKTFTQDIIGRYLYKTLQQASVSEDTF